LLSDACVRDLALDVVKLELIEGTEQFDYLGDIGVHLLDLASRFGIDKPVWTPPRRKPLLETDLRVPLSPMAAWEELTAPVNRARWEGLGSIEVVGGHAIPGLGTVTSCTADRLTTVEQIVEWQPFATFARSVRLPAQARLTTHHALQPDGDDTLLRVRWWGSQAALSHARRESERLRQLVT
jgi:hypothetical protein